MYVFTLSHFNCKHIVNVQCTEKNFSITYINVEAGFAGFPVLPMYFSRHLVPAFKSHDLFECACNGERRQTLLCSCVLLKVTMNKIRRIKTRAIDGIMYKQTGASHWSVSRIKVSELE